MYSQIVALAALFASAPTNDDTVLETQTLATEVRVESAYLPPGASRWEFRKILFPEGCRHIGHDIELLEETPLLAPDAHRHIVDWIEHEVRYLPSGYVAILSVGVAAYRSLAMAPGPASITVKLSVRVRCEAPAFEKFKEEFPGTTQ